MHELTRSRTTDEVAGAVAAATVRPGDEPVGGEVGATAVRAGEGGARQVQLAGHVDRDRLQARVEHLDTDTLDRGADGRRAVGRHRSARRRPDRRLRRAVQVEHGAAGRPGTHQFRTACVTGHTQHGEVVESVRRHRRKCGRCDHGVGHVLGSQDVGQLRTTHDAGVDDDLRGARRGRDDGLEDGRVETRCGEPQHPGLLGERQATDRLGREGGDARVGDLDTLRHAGGSGREHDVGDVVWGEMRPGRGLALPSAHRDTGHSVGQHVRVRDGHAHGGERRHRGDALDRCGRIDGEDGGSGACDAPERHRRVDPARQYHRDDVAPADPDRGEAPGQPIRPRRHLGVGQALSPTDDSDPLGMGCDSGVEDVREPSTGRDGVGCADRRCDSAWQRQIPDRRVRCRDHLRGERPHAVGELGDGLRVEQRRRIGDHPGDGCVGVGIAVRRVDGDLEVDLRGAGRDVDEVDGDPGQVQIGPVVVLERECHTEDRRVGGAAFGGEVRDDHLERDVGVGHRLDVDVADTVQQVDEPRGPVDRRPQRDGRDEHADQVVDTGCSPAGDGAADHDVVVGARPRQRDREQRVHRHERCRAVVVRQAAQRGPRVAVDRERQLRTGIGPHRRSRAVEREVRHPLDVTEPHAPAGELCRGEGRRVGRVAEEVALPCGVVGVLHAQGGQVRGCAREPRTVERHEVADHRCDRRAVADDVVDRDDEHPGVVGDAGQSHPQRGAFGEVESGTGGLGDHPIHRVGGRAEFDRRVDHHVGGVLIDPRSVDPGRGDDRDGRAVVRDEPGTQRLVAVHEVPDGRGEDVRSQCAGESQRERDDVTGAAGVHRVEEPDALLCRRQRALERHRAVTVDRHERRAVGTAGAAGDGGGEGAHTRVGEHVAHGDGHAETLGGRDRPPGGGQRVAAQVEDGHGHREVRHAQDLGGDRGEGLLGGGRRRGVGGDHDGRRGRQRRAVHLAVDRERQPVEDDDVRGHHVVRQDRRDGCADRVGLDARPRHVGDETVGGPVEGLPVGPVDRHHGRRDPRRGVHRGLDLAQLDPVPAQLDLVVGATGEPERPVAEADHVTAAVHPRSGRSGGVGDEPHGGQIGSIQIAAGELSPGQVEFARDAVGDGRETGVEDGRPGPRERHPDVGFGCRLRELGRHGPPGHVHRRLGRPVEVLQRGGRPRVIAVPAAGGGGIEGLPGEHDPSQRGRDAPGAQHIGDGVEQRRRRGQQGHTLPVERVDEIDGIADGVGVDDDESPAAGERCPQLRDGDVEGRGVDHRPDIVLVRRHRLVQGGQQRGDLTVFYDDALGDAGRPRGEDRVRRLARVRVDEGHVVGGVGGTQLVEGVDRHRRRPGEVVGIAHHGEDGPGRVEDRPQPRRRMGAVQRHIRGTGPHHGQQGHDQVDVTAEGDGHESSRARPGGDERAGEAVRRGVECCVGEFATGGVGHGDRVRSAARSATDQAGDGAPVGGADGRDGRVDDGRRA
ncbi:hypothetical protein LX14_002416 [Williamsia deligens]|nr:hypothetical protein [Williamsia deligens]